MRFFFAFIFICVFTHNSHARRINNNEIIESKHSSSIIYQIEHSRSNFQRSIKGKVLDDEGLPLTGANVLEAGTNNGTITDFEGNFSIQLENDDAILTISFVGYVDQSIDVSNGDSFNVSLSPKGGSLEEIIITGYGTTRKKDLVSSIAKVSGDALSNQPASSVSNLLQGRAAGLQVTAPDGDPSSAPTIRIRG